MNYRIISTKNIYHGRIFDITRTKLAMPGGTSFLRETVVHPGASAVIAQVTKDKIILIRQLRYATGQSIWEIPAGTLDKGESPLTCARRELEEETGFAARSFRKLVVFYTCPGFCTERIHLYLATGLRHSDKGLKQDADENINCRVFSRHQAQDMLRRGRIKDAKTLVGLMLWLQRR